MAAMVAGPMMELKKEDKTSGGGNNNMYPPDWWWAERQVSEVLAEHPGELVKTGEIFLVRLKVPRKSQTKK